jgi:hypothetical protein
MKLRDRLIQLAEEIATLRAALRAKEAELDRLLPDGELPCFPAAAVSSGVPVTVTTDATLIDQVLHFFATHQTEQIGPRALRALLELPPVQEKSLRATMGRLAADGRIRRVNRGRYAAIEEQKENGPNPSD